MKLVKESLNDDGALNAAEVLENGLVSLSNIIDGIERGEIKPDVDEFGEGWEDKVKEVHYIIGRLLNYKINMYDGEEG